MLVVIWSVLAAAPAAQAPDSCALTTTERIVAVGDVHGAYERFVAILRSAGLIDSRQRWIGGRAILVQAGDVLDRGPDSRRVLDLLRRLDRDAERAGGQVHPLLGNHEAMRVLSDWRYVSAGEYAAFRNGQSEELRDRVYSQMAATAEARAKAEGQRFDEAAFRRRFLDGTPLGAIEMKLAFGPDGEYGRWLRERDTMIRINRIVFVHGGISATTSMLGCKAINDMVRAELRSAATATNQEALSNSETGPLWYRGLATDSEASLASELEAILGRLDARAIVIGHTVAADGRIHVRFGGRVLQIDTGMLDGTFYPRGRASALEIEGDKVTAIYEDGRAPLTEVPQGQPAASR